MEARLAAAFDEMTGNGDGVRDPYLSVHQWLQTQKIDDLKRKRGEAEALFRRTGITFAVYGDDAATERLIPFDIIPRILSAAEWRPANSTAPQGSNNSVEMAEPAAQQSASSDENVWMQAYAAMAHDRVE